jgi:hypothetical protein
VPTAVAAPTSPAASPLIPAIGLATAPAIPNVPNTSLGGQANPGLGAVILVLVVGLVVLTLSPISARRRR